MRNVEHLQRRRPAGGLPVAEGESLSLHHFVKVQYKGPKTSKKTDNVSTRGEKRGKKTDIEYQIADLRVRSSNLPSLVDKES